MISSNADTASQLLALEHQWSEDLLDVSPLLLKLLGVIVVDHIKGLSAVSKVSRVNTDLLKALGNHHSNSRLEMDVGHERNIIPKKVVQFQFQITAFGQYKQLIKRRKSHTPVLKQTPADISACLSLPLALNSNSDYVRTSIGTLFNLLGTSMYIS